MRLGEKREIMLSVCVMNQKVEKHRFLSGVLTYWRVQGEVDRLR